MQSFLFTYNTSQRDPDVLSTCRNVDLENSLAQRDYHVATNSYLPIKIQRVFKFAMTFHVSWVVGTREYSA